MRIGRFAECCPAVEVQGPCLIAQRWEDSHDKREQVGSSKLRAQVGVVSEFPGVAAGARGQQQGGRTISQKAMAKWSTCPENTARYRATDPSTG